MAGSRYELLVKLAAGGMGSVFVGRVRGPMGFSRLVAIKRAHPHFVSDASFVQMLVDEAHLASRIHHPHVVSVLDVERVKETIHGRVQREVRLVMDYVEGATVAELCVLATERGLVLPPGVAVRIVLDAAAGLQAAHELSDESGAPLGIVHRDVSPQNLLLGLDGMTRVTDFGIAKATMRPGVTQDGALKGKLAYMAPEYVGENALDARSDVFALGAVLWELLVGRKLFKGNSEVDTLQLVARAEVPRISAANPSVGTALDDVMTSALAKAPADRFTSARAFANALETAARRAGLVAAHDEVGTLVREATRERLAERREKIKARAKELDALTMGGSTTTEELAAAVERAQEQIANESPAEAPPPTLREPDSAQSSSASAQIAASQVSFVTERTSEARPAASSSRRWAWAFALLSGALAAAVLLLWFNDSASSPSDRSQSSAAPLAPGSPAVATLVTPSTPASSSAAAPRSSNLGSATASAPPKPPSKPLLPPPVAAPTATSPAIAPNPYRR